MEKDGQEKGEVQVPVWLQSSHGDWVKRQAIKALGCWTESVEWMLDREEWLGKRTLTLASQFMSVGSPVESLGAQEVVEIRGPETCAEFRIEFRQVVAVGGDADTLGLGRRDASRLVLDSRGGVWLAPELIPYAVAHYRPDGGLTEVIGKRGQGPSEFRRIFAIGIDQGDTIHLLGDGKQVRVDPNGEFSSTQRLAAFPEAHLVLDDGTLVVNGSVPTAQGVGRPLHVVDRSIARGRVLCGEADRVSHHPMGHGGGGTPNGDARC